MPSTTSLKLSDSLKAAIAQVAGIEGKTSHALIVETLQSAMDAKAYVMARIRGGKSARPDPAPL